MNKEQKSDLRYLCFDKIMIKGGKIYFHHPSDEKVIQEFLKSIQFKASSKIIVGGEYGFCVEYQKE